MFRFLQVLTLFLPMYALGAAKVGDRSKGSKHTVENTEEATPILWRDPTDLESRDLFFGPGGKEHAPRGRMFVFIKEDLDGTNPKFFVREVADGPNQPRRGSLGWFRPSATSRTKTTICRMRASRSCRNTSIGASNSF